MKSELRQNLGTPHIRVAGLQIWILGRQFPGSGDFWDGNWLNISALCETGESHVWINGPIIHLSEIKAWLDSTEILYESLSGTAGLNCMEPELSVTIQSEKRGQLIMAVRITPDNRKQAHWYKFEIDQSYLPSVVSGCKAVLGAYPIRGENKA